MTETQIDARESTPAPSVQQDTSPATINDDRAMEMATAHKRWLSTGGKQGVRANFRNQLCQGVTFSTNLAQADFHGARFERCVFAPTVDLTEADFSEADLTGVNLSEVSTLSEHRLGASKMSYAKLPDRWSFGGLEIARDAAARAEKLLFLLIASCATVVVVARIIPHPQLFQATEGIRLPVLGLTVPVRTFFNLAPWLLLVVYLYLLATLAKLWKALRDLPAILPNHRLLFREIPASPNFSVMPFGWCWRTFAAPDKEADEARELRRLTRMDRWLAIVTVWWMTPLTIGWVWLSYLPRHAVVDTRIHVVAVVLGVAASVASYGKMLAHLTRGFGDHTPRRLTLPAWVGGGRSTMDILLYTGPEERPTSPNAPRFLRYGTVATCVAATLLSVSVVSQIALKDSACDDEVARYQDKRGGCYRLAANLERAEMKEVQLQEQNLNRAFLHGANLRDGHFEDAWMRGAQLSDVRAEEANFKDAHLENAILWEARLEKARLKEAYLNGADLRGAFLTGARLQGAFLSGAKLSGANLSNAIVCGAQITPGVTLAGIIGDPHGEEIWAGRSHQGLPGEGLGPVRPAYLKEKEDREGFTRWATAERQVERLAAYVIAQAPGGWLDRDTLRALVNGVELSMGASTQRRQIALYAFLGSYARRLDRDSVAYTPELRARLAYFIGTVQQKARNHCVLPAHTELPGAGPAPSPSAVWNAKVGSSGPAVRTGLRRT